MQRMPFTVPKIRMADRDELIDWLRKYPIFKVHAMTKRAGKPFSYLTLAKLAEVAARDDN